MLVIKGKDVIKWILKIVVVALILFFITKFLMPISKGTDKIINNIEKEKLISCIDDNIPAIKLYQKYNFQTVGIRKKYYNNVDNAILMTLYF